MKKILMAFAVGAVLLVSCNSTQDKEAAEAFCNCYATNDAAESTQITELMESADELRECLEKFKADFDGKVSQDGFASELKELCPDNYSKAEEKGMFE